MKLRHFWIAFIAGLLVGAMLATIYVMSDPELACKLGGGSMVPGWRAGPAQCLPGAPVPLPPK